MTKFFDRYPKQTTFAALMMLMTGTVFIGVVAISAALAMMPIAATLAGALTFFVGKTAWEVFGKSIYVLSDDEAKR